MTEASSTAAKFDPVEALMRGTPWEAAPREVSPRDEMYRAALAQMHGDPELARFEYFKTGTTIAEAHAQILRRHFGATTPITLLDFASGYGRVTRFFGCLLDSGAIWVADLQRDAVDFQVQTLGVHGFYSTELPSQLDGTRRFDAVFATSLFTHLPAASFQAWLAHLVRSTKPGGLLVFSTLDRALAGPPNADEGEVLFQYQSESSVLAPESYGTTWVTERFVRELLDELSSASAVERIERGLCNQQDLWIVASRGGDPDALDFQGQPELGFNEVTLKDHRLIATGWVVRKLGRRIERLTLSLDGEPLGTVPVNHDRPDIAAYFGQAHRLSGWRLESDLPGFRGSGRAAPLERFVLVEGFTRADERAVLWGGPLYGVLLACRDDQVQWLHGAIAVERRGRENDARVAETHRSAREDQLVGELAKAEGEIARMKASRLWKIRDAWRRAGGRWKS